MKLFVKNIQKEINEAQLEEIFAEYGEIVETKIIYDKITWESRGFGFVDFAKKTDAHKAIDGLNGKELQGKIVSVEIALEKR